MMCRKITITLMLFIYISAFFANSISAKEVLNNAEILLVYSDRLSLEDKKNIETIITTLTYQNHSVAYANLSECKGQLNRYKYVICYDIGSKEKEFIDELAKAKCMVFGIGNDFLEEYIYRIGADTYVTKFKDITVECHYGFLDNFQFNKLLGVEYMLLFEGDFTYEKGIISFNGKEQGFCIGNNQYRYIPSKDLQDDFVGAIFSTEISKWLWDTIDKLPAYTQFIVFDEVYPFTSTEQILEVIDLMIELEIPFAISVMPIYKNTEYPAMKRFCEVLNYAQAKGGAVILNAPIVQTRTLNSKEIIEYLTTAVDAYIKYGVYPLGFQVPLSWLYDDNGLEVLKLSKTVLVDEDENQTLNMDLNAGFNKIYKDGHQLIGPAVFLDDTLVTPLTSYATAAYIDIMTDINTLRQMLIEYRDTVLPKMSLWDISHSIYTNSSIIKYDKVYDDRALTINGEPVNLTYIPFAYEEDFDYNRGIMQQISISLKSQNRVLKTIVTISLVLFIEFIIQARRVNRRKFFYPKEK